MVNNRYLYVWKFGINLLFARCNMIIQMYYYNCKIVNFVFPYIMDVKYFSERIINNINSRLQRITLMQHISVGRVEGIINQIQI